MKSVGFWRDPHDPSGPGLDPAELVDPTWDPAERDAVIDYLRAGEVHMWMKGYASCRFRCGISDKKMGSRTLTDGTWIWPEGLPHYLEAHAVKPPEEFLEHVRRRLR